MNDLAQTLSAEDKAYFGDESVAEALADPEIASEIKDEAETESAEKPAAVEKPDAVEVEKPDADKAEQKTVPLGALHEERERRKELQQQVSRMEDRFNQFVTALQRPAPAAEAPKPVDEDPLGALKRHDEALSQQDQQRQHAQQFQNFQRAVEHHEGRFRTETPDYDAAVTHLRQVKASEYQAMGLQPEQIVQQINADAVNLAAHALRIGRNPAEVAYALAKTRGYTATAPAAVAAAEAKPAAAAEATVSGEEKMAMIEKGTQAARSLSGGGGGNADLTLESLANMDDDDFGKITDSQWRKLWGA